MGSALCGGPGPWPPIPEELPGPVAWTARLPRSLSDAADNAAKARFDGNRSEFVRAAVRDLIVKLARNPGGKQ